MRESVKDGSLAAAVLESGTPSTSVPAALIEACGLPEIGSRLGYLSVRMDDGIGRPFTLDGSMVDYLDTGFPAGTLMGMAFDPFDGSLYVVDTLTDRVLRIAPR